MHSSNRSMWNRQLATVGAELLLNIAPGIGGRMNEGQHHADGHERVRPVRRHPIGAGAARRRDIALGIEPGQKPMLLENDRAVETRPFHPRSIDPDVAVVISVEAKHEPQQGGLVSRHRSERHEGR